MISSRNQIFREIFSQWLQTMVLKYKNMTKNTLLINLYALNQFKEKVFEKKLL